jgi:hypothetical protein
MTPAERVRALETLAASLSPTPACVPIERLGQSLTEVERRHADACARCQAELALWTEFQASEPMPEDGAAVQWVIAELQRRRNPAHAGAPSRGMWSWLRPRALMPAAALLVLAVAIGYFVIDRVPRVHEPAGGPQEYRSAEVSVIAPRGDVARAPSALEWVSFDRATRYDVVLLEVDHSILWRGSSTIPRAELPASVVAQLVPGKTVIWEVSAVNGSGTVMAASAPQRFRVAPGS